ncbi:hypothetical protein [Pseudomonas viridiflava]|uniref:hypothetical protein n=1 Tax=Pseudomonas viridiflava TaxID=33069 RepID=UPI0013CF0B25|nr:hypothetical protein [Pseudomonas viridiflava]
MIFKSLTESLAKSFVHISSDETNSTVVEKYRLSGMRVDEAALTNSLLLIRDRDSFSISFEYTGSDEVDSLTNREGMSIGSFCDRLNLQIEEDPGVNGVLTVTVTKGFARRVCTIYSLSLIAAYWRKGGIVGAAAKLWALADKAFVLESCEITKTYNTGRFIFRPSTHENTSVTNPELTNREKLISARDKCCFFYHSKAYPFLPEDFDFNLKFEHVGIADMFDTLKLAFSLIFIADVSSLDKPTMTATIKGYRHVTGAIQLDGSKDASVAAAYFEIYQWVYSDANIVDKLGIARNLLSIHIDGDRFRVLQSGSMPAVISNYSIYLKENVKQYIEVKNKLSDQIQKQSEKASDMVKSIGTYLKTSIFSVYSFVVTTFIIRSMSKASTEALFSDAVYLVFIMFLCLSIGTLVYAWVEAEEELRRFKSIYESFKSRFDDLLSKSDRDRILQNDKEYNRDVNYVKESRRRAVFVWAGCLIVIFIFVTIIKCTQPELTVPPVS